MTELQTASFSSSARKRDRFATVRDSGGVIRFIFWNWLSTIDDVPLEAGSGAVTSRVAHLDRVAKATGSTRSALMDRLERLDFGSKDRGRVERDLRDLQTICELIRPGDTSVIDFASRLLLQIPNPPLGILPAPGWWSDVRRMRSPTALETIIAARSLEVSVGLFSDGVSQGAVPPTFEEWRDRHRVGIALLHAATSASGHAAAAQNMAARLCPLFIDEFAEFLWSSPRWVPCCHFVDRAMRIHGGTTHGQVVSDLAERFVLERVGGHFALVQRISERPPRVAAAAKLARRVGRESGSVDRRRGVAELFCEIARPASTAVVVPPRARRFALWALAELAADSTSDERISELARDAVAASVADPVLADVAMVLEEFNGGYLNWEQSDEFGRVDFVSVDPINTLSGRLEWPMVPLLYAALKRHVLPDRAEDQFQRPWDRVPRRDVYMARRLLLEALIHPDLVRVKAASDALRAAGPNVGTAVCRALSDLVTEDGAGALPDHVVEIALNIIGYLRTGEAPYDALATIASDTRRSVDVRSAAVASLGDVMHRTKPSGSQRMPKGYQAAEAGYKTWLLDEDPGVVQSAIHAVHGLRLTDCFPTILQIGDGRSVTPPAQMARWCLESWSLSDTTG